MTTGWGADRFDATRAACLIAMAAEAEDQVRADALWKPLNAAGRAAVLRSLAAHWRQLLHQAAPRLSAPARGQHFLTLLHALGRDCCDPVRDFALGALAGLGIELSAPACGPCTRLAADAFCQAQLRFVDAVGWRRQHLATIYRQPAS
jgi:hypothetical protein